jgi:hypothetical protein
LWPEIGYNSAICDVMPPLSRDVSFVDELQGVGAGDSARESLRELAKFFAIGCGPCCMVFWVLAMRCWYSMSSPVASLRTDARELARKWRCMCHGFHTDGYKRHGIVVMVPIQVCICRKFGVKI